MLKTLFTFIGCILIPLTMTQCGTTKTDLQETPFQTGEVYFEKWVAGVQGGGSGINLFIPISEMPEGIQLDKAFFRSKVAPITMSPENVFIARYQTANNRERDITMHDDAIEETVNTPEVSESFPFPLKDNEVGITYSMNGVLAYTKLTKIIQKESIPRPSSPPRGGLN